MKRLVSILIVVAILFVAASFFITKELMLPSFSAIEAGNDPLLDNYFFEQVDARKDVFRIKFYDAKKEDFQRLFDHLKDLALVRSNADVYQIDAKAFYRFGAQVFDIELSYRMSDEEYDTVMQWVREKLDPFLAMNPRRIDVLRFIHDTIVKQTEYDEKYEKKSAYNAIFDHLTLCEGYASLGHLMLNYADIENRLITGKANNVNHIWNLVKIDKNWYHVDFTWDDPIFQTETKDPNFVMYEFYMRSDQTMEQTHQWDKTKYPSAPNDWE